MKLLSKTFAALIGAAMLSTTPMSANAASFRTVPALSLQDSVVVDVHRRRFRHRHSRRRGRGGGVAAGIIGGIILGGIIAESNRGRRHRRSRRRDDAHIDWCYNRYRSYRAYDNTFQPYRGRRRPCFSPYY